MQILENFMNRKTELHIRFLLSCSNKNNLRNHEYRDRDILSLGIRR